MRAGIDLTGWSLQQGIRGALACGLPLLAAESLHEPVLSGAALIGLWVALADPGWPARTRILAISAFVLASAVGCFFAVLLRPWPLAAAGFALFWCFTAILTRVWGDSAATAGTLSAVAVVIVLGTDEPESLEAAALVAAVTLAGGLWGAVLAFGIGFERPGKALRRTLASVFVAEANATRRMAEETAIGDCGEITKAIETARGGLVTSRRSGLGGKAGVQAQMLLLGDAQGVLMSLMALQELLRDVPLPQRPVRRLSNLADRLDAIAAPISDHHRLESLPKRLDADGAGPVSAALRQADVWTRTATNRMAKPAQGASAAAPIPDQAVNRLEQLRINLTSDSLALRHAARYALTAAA